MNVGAEILIRVGATGAIHQEIGLWDVILVDSAVRSECTTVEYIPSEYRGAADFRATQTLVKAAEQLNIRYHVGTVRTNDAFYAGQRAEGVVERCRTPNVLSFET